MIGWAKELKFPLMAGSSLPVTWRRPELELQLETPIEDGLVAAYGPLEVYGFHALEALQVMMERRKGGETGVKAVTCLTGKDVWKAGDDGRWSWDLLDAALGRSETVNLGDIRRNVGSMSVQAMPPTPATAFLIEYRDGTARHGPAAQRPRAGLHVRGQDQGRDEAGVVPVPSAAAARGASISTPGRPTSRRCWRRASRPIRWSARC